MKPELLYAIASLKDALAKLEAAAATTSKPTAPTPREVIHAVALHYGLAPSELAAKTKIATVVRARHVAAYIAHHVCNCDHGEIGAVLNRDRSAICHAVHSIQHLLETDARTRVTVAPLMETFGLQRRTAA